MNSTPSKVFTVIVLNCENPSHSRKIAELLRDSFAHRSEHITANEPISLTVMVKADSLDSIRGVISPALGKARPAIGEMSFLSDGGAISSEPPDFMQFFPPEK